MAAARQIRSLSRLSALPTTPFPPVQALKSAASTPDLPPFSADEWGSIQAAPPSALSALAARLAFLPSSHDASPLLAQALTHPSCLSTYSRYYPSTPLPPTNKSLAAVGNGLLGLFAAEWVHATYPHLPTRAIKAAVSAYVGPRTLSEVAKEWGALPYLRWARARRSGDNTYVLQVDALASFPRSLVALLSQHGSLAQARQFTHDHFLSRTVDLEPLLKFRAPKIALAETVAKFGRERPISRLLSETGRFTNSPIYVVGIYSGTDKLGEGFGSSLRMAEFRAAENALHQVYLTRQPNDLVRLPTSAFPASFSTGEQNALNALTGPLANYSAPDLGEAEVLYASAGRSGMLARKPESSP